MRAGRLNVVFCITIYTPILLIAQFSVSQKNWESRWRFVEEVCDTGIKLIMILKYQEVCNLSWEGEIPNLQTTAFIIPGHRAKKSRK